VPSGRTFAPALTRGSLGLPTEARSCFRRAKVGEPGGNRTHNPQIKRTSGACVDLRVGGILDLEPGRLPAVAVMPPALPLRHDALKVMCARRGEHIAATEDRFVLPDTSQTRIQ
jgi:hypothetical protein